MYINYLLDDYSGVIIRGTVFGLVFAKNVVILTDLVCTLHADPAKIESW